MRFPRTVYAIQHNETGRIYVGSTCELRARLGNHLSALRRNKHRNALMQEDFNNYGDNYSFFVLDVIEKWEDRHKEQEWMKKLKTNDPKVGYNRRDWYFTRQSIEISNGVPTPNK